MVSKGAQAAFVAHAEVVGLPEAFEKNAIISIRNIMNRPLQRQLSLES